MLNPKIEGEKCSGGLAFCTIDFLQCYWQFSLEEEVRDYVTFVTRIGMFTPTQMCHISRGNDKSLGRSCGARLFKLCG